METNILRFEHPEYLYWLAIIPILIGIYIQSRKLKILLSQFLENME